MDQKEQLSELKSQVISQINTTFPEDKKIQAIQQINSMSDSQFLEFLKQNNLLGELDKEYSENENKTPFRLIIEEKIPSYKIDENKEAVAVLEIKPISKAHIIIIPKIPVQNTNNLPKGVYSLAKNISKKISSKFKPKEIILSPSMVLGESILNLIPKYSNETPNSERNSVQKEELEKLKQELEPKKRTKIIKEPKIKQISEGKLWLPKRIP